MQDALAVQIREPRHCLPQEAAYDTLVYAEACFPHQLVDGTAWHPLHHDLRGVFKSGQREYFDDVGMIKRGQHLVFGFQRLANRLSVPAVHLGLLYCHGEPR